MQEFIAPKIFWLCEKKFVRVAQKTFVSLFPFVLLASITRVLSVALFFRYGFINQLFSVSSWLPFFDNIGTFFSNFSFLVGGLTGLLTSYFSARYTAEINKKDADIAGITGFIFSLIIYSYELFNNSFNDGLLTKVNLPLNVNLVVAVFMGYIVGEIFHFTDKDSKKITKQETKRVRPIILSLLLAIILNSLLYIGTIYNIFTSISNFFTELITSGSTLITSFLNAIVTNLFTFIGMSSTYQMTNFTDDVFSIENLTYVLKNHTLTNIPHPFTMTTLYHGFGAFGGIGSLLALVIAILLVSKNKKNRKIGILGIFPTLFNNGAPVMLGIPVMFNIVFLIPFILAPILNMFVAYVALKLTIIPPVVYPVPPGTPNPLIAFIGTGGSLRAFAIALIAFMMDIVVYIPFVKLNDRISEQLMEKEGSIYD